VRETSLYAAAQMRPKATLTIALMAGMAAGAAFFGGRRLMRPVAAETPEPAPRRGLAAWLKLARAAV
jgi:hypothetical protein